ALLTAQEYLKNLTKCNIDTLILGCTHYPILKKTISKVVGKNVLLIDSGEETAKAVKRTLEEKYLLNTQNKKGIHKFFVTDFPNNFKLISERFLGRNIRDVKKVKLS
ncbi:MAG: glutamate racemase, partial [Ignavibacteriae bacterium]|nr:glutamate racemase [Ignavibacteriota bacterium]